MLPDINHTGETALKWQPAENKSKLLPGSDLSVIGNRNEQLQFSRYRNPLFTIGYRVLRFFKNIRLSITDRSAGIRLEAVLDGDLSTVSARGEDIVLHTGQYHLSKHQRIETFFKKGTSCYYFITHYSDEMLKAIGVKELVKPSPVKQLTTEMNRLIQKVLNNPLDEQLRDFYYSNCIRELLLLHMVNEGNTLYSGLTDKDLAAIYAADTILQQNLHEHDDIPVLARRVMINETKLKVGFQQVYHMGVFERLTHHRMEYAKSLLSTTTKSVTDIATDVGYSTRNSFITAFKRNFDITPKQWKLRHGNR